jgi:hypothetical protein
LNTVGKEKKNPVPAGNLILLILLADSHFINLGIPTHNITYFEELGLIVSAIIKKNTVTSLCLKHSTLHRGRKIASICKQSAWEKYESGREERM